jgi:putative ABC transport system substrate-binding protein
MRRREFILLGAAFWPFAVHAQAKAYRVGFVSTGYDATLWQAFLDGLREHGWEEGRNLIVERRSADGRPERLPELASELVTLGVDVIVASAPPAVRAAQQATRTIPIIMTAVSDPIQLGSVSSLAEPGGNITGVASRAGPGLLSKLLEVAKDALPFATRLGILFNASNPLNYVAFDAPEISKAASDLHLELVWLPVRSVSDFEPAFVSAHQRNADAIIVIGDPLLFLQRERIHDLAQRHKVPTIWTTREYLSGRGLLSHGPSLRAMMRHAAAYVDRMLRGGKPANTPVEQPLRYELVVNLKTASALGVTIPPTLLARADEVIE